MQNPAGDGIGTSKAGTDCGKVCIGGRWGLLGNRGRRGLVMQAKVKLNTSLRSDQANWSRNQAQVQASTAEHVVCEAWELGVKHADTQSNISRSIRSMPPSSFFKCASLNRVTTVWLESCSDRPAFPQSGLYRGMCWRVYFEASYYQVMRKPNMF